MIKLKIEKYCEKCAEFEPSATTSTRYSNNVPIDVSTVVTCEHAEKCCNLIKYLGSQLDACAISKTCQGCVFDHREGCNNPSICIKNSDGYYSGYTPKKG